MKKRITIILLIITSITGWAQESVLFKHKIKPNKKYTTELKTNTYAEIEFIADKETIELLKSQGIKFPMIVESESSIRSSSITDKLDKNGEIPAKIEYEKVISKTTTNGKTKIKENPFAGVKILGKYDIESKFVLDTIIGDKVTQQLRSSLKTILINIQQNIEFPDKPMKVGDTFKREIPMEIPMESMNPILIKINTEYLLTKIEEDKAFFDFKQTVNLDMNQKQIDAVASGTGTGTAEFDIKNEFLTKYKSVVPMNMTIKLNEKISMKTKMTSTTNLEIKIE